MFKVFNTVKQFFINNRPEAWVGAMYHKDTGEIEDWSHKIQISTLGNVRYTEAYKATNKNIKDKPAVVNAGNKYSDYQYVKFLNDDNKTTLRRIHRMVLSSFCPLPENNDSKMDADHIDYNQTNNKLSNLQWMDRKAHQKRRRS